MYEHSKERLKYLSTVEKGWLDGEGEAITSLVVDRTRELLELLHQNNIPEPILFPTEEGYILVEWHTDTITTIDVEPESYYLFSLDTFDPNGSFQKENVTDLDEVVRFSIDYVLQ